MQLYGQARVSKNGGRVRHLDARYVSIVSRLGADTLYLIVSKLRFIEYIKLCISLYPDLSQIQGI